MGMAVESCLPATSSRAVVCLLLGYINVGTKCSCRRGHRWHISFRDLPVIFVLAVIVCVGQAATRSAADEQKQFVFDIPRQSLASALDSYSATTGIVGFYRAQLAYRRMSKPITGQYSPEIALQLLLDDSGLAAKYASAHAFVLVPSAHNEVQSRSASTVALAAIGSQDAPQRGYSALLQERINAALCARSSTRPGTYRVALNFRVGPAGHIENFNLLGTSGDSSRDDAISDALGTLAIGRAAPSHMSQPFTMIVLPASSGGVVDCAAIQSAMRHE